jgi:predicted TIM-barrel fold metal-dependent hydrolase
MNEWNSKITGIVDGHVHMGNIAEAANLLAIRDITGIEKMNLVSIQNPEAGAGLPQSFYMKAQHPETFFVFAGLDHGAQLFPGQVTTPALAEQVDEFVALGCDGLKMIEGKPTSRRVLDIPVNAPYFADYWARVEELGLPIVWHVNDPEEFWDPDKIPGWAKSRDWGYGPEDAQKEQLYAEVDDVLARYPDLNVIFAHFYFLSADLDRAARFFDAHPNVSFDLTPGIEMLYNMSKNPDASRAFFIKYADRIVFGTDLTSRWTVTEGHVRAGIVFRWLESDDTFRVPETVDFLLGPPEDGIIRGMSLPDDVLTKIYGGNFARYAGTTPRPLDVSKAIALSERIAANAEAISGTPAAETEAALVARKLAGGV